jgi:formylglycine-generating enzyme required for sulfatase activity
MNPENSMSLPHLRRKIAGISIVVVGLLSCAMYQRFTAPSRHQQSYTDGVIRLDGHDMSFRRVSPRQYGYDRSDFYMLETEVTNAVYARYLRATGKTKGDTELASLLEKREAERRATGRWTSSTTDPMYEINDNTRLWKDATPPPGAEQHPVVLVNLEQASAFCEWLTRAHPDLGTFRLPTKAEWRIAAYGNDRPYPWGNKPNANAYHYREWNIADDDPTYGSMQRMVRDPAEFIRRAEPVTARTAGRTPEGLFGMWGNAAELVISEERRQNRHFVGLGALWLGGDFDTHACQPRQDYWGYTHNSDVRRQSLGFRVLLDAADRHHHYQHFLPATAPATRSIYSDKIE